MGVRTERATVEPLERGSRAGPPGARGSCVCSLLARVAPGAELRESPSYSGAQGSSEHLPREVPEPDWVCDSVLQRL